MNRTETEMIETCVSNSEKLELSRQFGEQRASIDERWNLLTYINHRNPPIRWLLKYLLRSWFFERMKENHSIRSGFGDIIRADPLDEI